MTNALATCCLVAAAVAAVFPGLARGFVAPAAGSVQSKLSPLLTWKGAPDPKSTERHLPADIADWFVDCTNGDDTETGTDADHPVKTINMALLLIRAQRRAGEASSANRVLVRGGLCRLEAPLRLTKADSGASADAPLIIQGDGRTALSGAREVLASAFVKGEDDVLVADVSDIQTLAGGDIKGARWVQPGANTDSGGTFSAALRWSRWPKLVGDGSSTPNWLFAKSWSQIPAPQEEPQLMHIGVAAVELPGGALDPLAPDNLVGAYALVFGCQEKDNLSQLSKIEAVSNGNHSGNGTLAVRMRNAFTVDQRFFLQNVPFAIEPGEFYHDQAAGKIYVAPPAAPRPAGGDGDGDGAAARMGFGSHNNFTVEVAVGGSLVEVDGAQHVVLSNLTFVDTTFFADGFWDGPGRMPTDAAIRINNSTHSGSGSGSGDVSVEACNFLASLGGYGVVVGNSSTGTNVTGCVMDAVGEGGVAAFGYDTRGIVPAHPGAAAGHNQQPADLRVNHNAMRWLGKNLAHVGGVVLRAATGSRVDHNRITDVPRYGLQVDSFYDRMNARFNVLEYNILARTNRLTTDTGAVEILGSGDPGLAPGPGGWWLANTLRYNNISETIGSSSADHKHVCVHGVPDKDCRDLAWGVYLDGGASGITVEGNIISATLHGAVFDNAGGNNTIVNNILVGEEPSTTVMDFGIAGVSPARPTTRNVSGSILQHNIIVVPDNNKTHAIASQVTWQAEQLKEHGSDHNLYFMPGVTEKAFAGLPVFPAGMNMTDWQSSNKQDLHSLYADPEFEDAAAGNYNLKPHSPALKHLGFKPIPPIEAPEVSCGSGDCLEFFFSTLYAT